uniref:Molybdopterin synthase catalytic subunit n=1 Tax=Ascaris suum TaxID=6253 RepID=F1L0I8_ASCSU
MTMNTSCSLVQRRTMKGTIIGIAGCTNAGKTTIARSILQKLRDKKQTATIVSQDDFFHNRELVRCISKESDPSIRFCNYDSPDAIDERRFVEAILNAAVTHDNVVVEGNMLTELPSVYNLISRILFLTLDRETCLERRLQRSDYDPPDEPGYFDQVVWPAYQRHLSNALKLIRESDRLTFVDAVTMDTNNEKAMDKFVTDFCVDLVRIQENPICISDAVDFVTMRSTGGTSLFIGTTRDTFDGKGVVHLEYEAYNEMAYKEMRKICAEVHHKFPQVHRVAIIHRIGVVKVGEASVAIATSAPHRTEAIRATELALDELKRRVPIWKKEVYADGTCSWKENKECKCSNGSI